MNLVEAVGKLPKHKVQYIHSVIAEAAIASELNGYDKAKQIVRYNKNISLGTTKAIFTALEALDAKDFENVKKALVSR
jgi:hypothetical protein